MEPFDIMAFASPHKRPSFPKIVRLNNNSTAFCPNPNCKANLDPSRDFAGAINHVIEEGYKLLHIGTESENGDEGLYHFSVAHLERIDSQTWDRPAPEELPNS